MRAFKLQDRSFTDKRETPSHKVYITMFSRAVFVGILLNSTSYIVEFSYATNKVVDATYITTKTPTKYITADIGKLTIIPDNVSLATFGTSQMTH